MKAKSLLVAGAAIMFTVAVSVAGERSRPMMVDNDQDSYQTANYQDTVPGKKDKKKKDTTKKRDTSFVAYNK
jgi:hypothetical protein